MTGTDRLLADYLSAHARSAELHLEALKHFAASGATHVVRAADPFRPYITKASGSRKWDVDGNEYVDFTMGHGALILGHSHPDVVRAVQEQAAKGFHYGDNHELEVRWAGLIARLMPAAERVEFCASGQEANMLAMLLARVHTGRRRVLRFIEDYHGWADELAGGGEAGCAPGEVTDVPLNDLAAVERELATRSYALVILEGGGGHMGGLVPINLDFQRALPDVARRYGTLYCIDEVVTGFRDAMGGWQELVGVRPDLSTIGKCAGGGMAVGAVVGRADVFASLGPGAAPGRAVYHAGTWNANPMAAAAGVAACTLYLDGGPQRRAREVARLFRDRGNEMLRRSGISGRLYGRSIIHFYLGALDREAPALDFEAPTADPEALLSPRYSGVEQRLSLHLLQRGVATIGGGMFVFSAAHTEGDVAQTLAAFEASLAAMSAEGTLPHELWSTRSSF